MMKKISAVLLALVLCLSVVVLPASAAGFDANYEFAEGKRLAYKLELDKPSYAPGEIVTVKLYLHADEGIQLHTGSVLFAVDPTQFDITDSANDSTAIRSSATSNAVYQSFYNEITSGQWAWQKSAIKGRVETASTEEEAATYDEYLKYGFQRNTAASHPNAGSNQAGLPAADVNADTDPFITFQLKLRDDIAAGTQIHIAITSGSVLSTPAQTAYQSFTDGAIKPAALPTSALDVSEAVATATVAAAGPTVALDKRQINMELTEDGKDVTGNFAFRAISTITDADWEAYFANTGVADAKENAIQAVGIVAADKSTFNMEAAQAAAEANYAEPTTETPDYKVAWTNYIQKAGDDAAAYFGARVDTTKDTCADLSYIGVVAYLDGEGALQFLYYDAADTVDLRADYETNKDKYLGWLASQA